MPASVKTKDLITECKREFENCLYTAASLHEWFKWRLRVKTVFIVVPLVLGSFATLQLVKQSQDMRIKVLATIAAFVAGIMPTIYAALKYDDELEKCKHAAAEFTNLRDRFRQVAIISSKKSFKEFEADFMAAMARMDKLRKETVVAPEWCFKDGQKKIKAGDYTFDVDLTADQQPDAEPPTAN